MGPSLSPLKGGEGQLRLPVRAVDFPAPARLRFPQRTAMGRERMAESGKTNGGSLIWNFKVLGHNALDGFGGMGEGMSMQLAKDGRRILWMAHESAPKNFTAVDGHDPRPPNTGA